jgi:hypothetical protein
MKHLHKAIIGIAKRRIAQCGPNLKTTEYRTSSTSRTAIAAAIDRITAFRPDVIPEPHSHPDGMVDQAIA